MQPLALRLPVIYCTCKVFAIQLQSGGRFFVLYLKAVPLRRNGRGRRGLADERWVSFYNSISHTGPAPTEASPGSRLAFRADVQH